MANCLDEKEMLISAINVGDVDLVKDLIGNGAAVNAQYRTPLSCAIQAEQPDIVDVLLRSGADVNEHGLFGEAPLVVAVRTGDVHLVQSVLDAGGRVNGDADMGSRSGNKLAYTTPMHVAATLGSYDVLNVLLAANGNVGLRNFKHETPLHLASYKGRTKSARRLISCGASMDATDKLGYMPLHHAVAEGHTTCVTELCKLGCSMNLPTAAGSTPLMLAIKKGHLGALTILLQFDPDLNRRDQDAGRTAAHKVVEACPHRLGRKNVISVNKEIELLEALVQAGADINVVDSDHETPLHLCVRTACPPLLEYLIKCDGCHVHKRNTKGLSALSIACSMRENNRMIRMLVQQCPLLVSLHSAGPGASYELSLHNLMLILCERDNLPCMRLLLEAGYVCSRTEAELCRDLKDGGAGVKTFVDEHLLQPWPLQRACRRAIRDLLQTQIHSKVYKLPIPQKLRDFILLQNVFVPP